jgi:hypothetical protein
MSTHAAVVIGLGVLAAGLVAVPANGQLPAAPAPEVGYPLAWGPAPLPVPVRGMDDLVRMDRGTLEGLYRGGTLAPVPAGFVPGRAIYNPGSRTTVTRAKVTGMLWKGKVFTEDGIMVNRLAGDLEAVRARVFFGESWLDGHPSLIFDYAGMSKQFGDVRDEVREIAPGLYLGLTYVRKCPAPELSVFFALDARPCAGKPAR